MKISYYAPSLKRPQKSITQKLYPFVKLVVKESEANEYLKNGNEIITVPDMAQGNVSRIRNYILDNLYDNSEAIFIIDDDCNGVYVYQKQKRIKLNSDELLEFIESNTILCKEWGYYHWGINCVPDKGAYREHTPFGTLQYIGSPFGVHIKNDIRYDEELPLKEDYDYTLQHIKKYNGCLRINYANYEVKQSEQVGGCSTYRNLKEEKLQFEKLQNKWGSKIITIDKSSKKTYDFNPIIKIPLKGI